MYVTQVSVEERIAQQCHELKTKYDKISSLQNDYYRIAKISVKKSYEERAEELRAAVQTNYERVFSSYIIPFSRTTEVFSEVLDRAFKKLPLFSKADNASDKGFKDTLIWLSVLSYFKENGENTVFFVSGDKGFRDNAEILCKEFKEFTGKTLEIKDNSYYNSIMETVPAEKAPVKQEKLPDVGLLREQIRNTIESLCYVETEDYMGFTHSERTFTTTEKIDADYMKVILSGLKGDISRHIFDENVPAFEILALDDRIVNGRANIPMVALENAMRLHDEIEAKYPDLIKQFYSASANIINQNYIAPSVNSDDADDELPF